MEYSISVIDDGVIRPAKESGLNSKKTLNSICLEKMLEKESYWEEPQLYTLFKTLLNSTDRNGKGRKVYAFADPHLFSKNFKDGLFRSEVIVYDWEYPTITDPEEKLWEILNTSYSIIYIFSGKDKQDEIDKTINSERFKRFSNRLRRLDKGNGDGPTHDGPTRLIEEIEKMYKENFSFKFGKELRSKTMNALDQVLVRLGELHIEETLKLFGDENHEQIDDKLKDMISEKIKHSLIEDQDLQQLLMSNGLEQSASEQLIETITERVRNDIVASVLKNAPPNVGEKGGEISEEISKELWSYRLYYSPSDDRVRKGDIIYCNKVEKDKHDFSNLYLVITPACHLRRFWDKNLGYINLIKLYSVVENKGYIRERRLLTKKNEIFKKKFEIKSLTDSIDAVGGNALFFPYIKIKNNGNSRYDNYIAYPKEITSIPIEMPEELHKINEAKKRDKPLQYKYWKGFERIATLGEPFLTPVIMNIMSAISGYGTPDYPGEVQNYLTVWLKEKLTCNTQQ